MHKHFSVPDTNGFNLSLKISNILMIQLDEGVNILIKPRPGSDLTNSNAPSPPHKVQRSVSSTHKPRRPTDQGELWKYHLFCKGTKLLILSNLLRFFLSCYISLVTYSKRPQGDNKYEDSGRKGSSGSTKVPPSPNVLGDSKKSSTPSTVSVPACVFETKETRSTF